MKGKLKRIINKRFGDFKKIILYKNPNEFSYMYIEKVNPTHVGIIWGRRKKHLNKGTNFIRLGKVYFSLIPILMGIGIISYISLYLVCLIGFYTTITALMYLILFELPLHISARFTPCQI